MNDIKGIIEDVEKSNLVSNKVIKKVIKIIGQEEWNNIHDEESDICTTTGELLITLQGIAELEKENAELREKLEDTEKVRDYWKASSFDWRHKCTNKKSFKVAVKAQRQLAKAKELIKEMLSILPKENIEGIYEITEEAEQFIRKSE